MSRRKGVWILCVPGAGSRQNPHVRELPLSWWFRCRGAGGIRFCMTAAAHTVVKTPGGYLMAYGGVRRTDQLVGSETPIMRSTCGIRSGRRRRASDSKEAREASVPIGRCGP
jgi:hypothetical protein